MQRFSASIVPTAILLCVSLALPAHANNAANSSPANGNLLQVSVEAGINAFQGDYKWNEQGSGGSPDVGGDFNIYDTEADGEQVRIQVEFLRSWLKNTVWEFSSSSSDVDDSAGSFAGLEYSGNDRTSPKNPTHASISGDDFSDDRFALAYVRKSDRERILAMIGVIDAEHNFTVQRTAGNSGQSLYKATWKGVWFGVEFSEQAGKHQVSFRAEYHIPDYEADLDWGLRDFTATQKGDGRISIYTLRYDYWLFKFASLWVSASAHDWSVDNATEVKYYNNGNTETVDLNDVRWKALSTAAGIKLRF